MDETHQIHRVDISGKYRAIHDLLCTSSSINKLALKDWLRAGSRRQSDTHIQKQVSTNKIWTSVQTLFMSCHVANDFIIQQQYLHPYNIFVWQSLKSKSKMGEKIKSSQWRFIIMLLKTKHCYFVFILNFYILYWIICSQICSAQ